MSHLQLVLSTSKTKPHLENKSTTETDESTRTLSCRPNERNNRPSGNSLVIWFSHIQIGHHWDAMSRFETNSSFREMHFLLCAKLEVIQEYWVILTLFSFSFSFHVCLSTTDFPEIPLFHGGETRLGFSSYSGWVCLFNLHRAPWLGLSVSMLPPCVWAFTVWFLGLSVTHSIHYPIPFWQI